MRFAAPALTFILLSVPSLASNVVGISGMSDTSGAVVNERGVVTVDARVVPQSGALGTGLFVQAGIIDGFELGLGALNGIDYRAGMNAAVIAPWVRARLATVGKFTFSIDAGAAVDVIATSHTVLGSEALLTRSFDWGSMDFNLGAGVVVGSGLPIGHTSAVAYINLPVNLILLTEVFGYLAPTGPNVGQRLGLGWVASKHLAVDLSLGVVEDPRAVSLLTWLPQVGTTLTF
jgi:hypothetical protein